MNLHVCADRITIELLFYNSLFAIILQTLFMASHVLLFHWGWCQSWSRCSPKSGTPSEPAHISTGREQNPICVQHVTAIARYL